MGLYPDTLFHFTDKKSLFGILNNCFNVSYSRERISGTSRIIQFAVPMVSFCDLRLSEIKEHMHSYGTYGIGLTKEWAIERKLNPVMYVSKESLFTQKFIESINELHQLTATTLGFENAYISILNTFRYMKNYSDVLERQGKIFPNFIFANEREWRYVPEFRDGIHNYISTEKIENREDKIKYNNILGEKLTFHPNDIKYIIVKNDSEIYGLIKKLKKVYIKYTNEDRSRLYSRILTYNQIMNDI
jgi:hypothetical protein